MLQNKDSKIITGTTEGLKSTAAWTPARNLLFLNIMGALGEAECMRYNYDKIYIAGGMLQLSESSTYPDNSPYFCNAVMSAFKYGTLIGNRFEPLYCLSNLMKYEQFILMKEFELENVYRWTISCDRPTIECPTCDHVICNTGSDIVDGVACNCMKDGMPACGSGLLSYWSSKMVGLDDTTIRNFYKVKDDNYKAFVPDHIKKKQIKSYDIEQIIDRILLPKDKIEILKQKLEAIKNEHKYKNSKNQKTV